MGKCKCYLKMFQIISIFLAPMKLTLHEYLSCNGQAFIFLSLSFSLSFSLPFALETCARGFYFHLLPVRSHHGDTQRSLFAPPPFSHIAMFIWKICTELLLAGPRFVVCILILCPRSSLFPSTVLLFRH